MSLLDLHRSSLRRARSRAAKEQQEIASIAEKISQKQKDVARAQSPSRIKTLSRDIERLWDRHAKAEKALSASQKRIGDLSVKITREEEKQHRALESSVAGTNAQIDQLHGRVRDIENELLGRVQDAVANDPVDRKFDIFLSHTHSDKEVAAELYQELEARDLDVWFDGAELELGRPLTRQIDRGIAKSKIGVILVTKAFLEGRFWTETEMGALINSRKRVIPVLDGVGRTDLSQYSPILADLVGLSTEDEGFDEMAERIALTLTTAEESGVD